MGRLSVLALLATALALAGACPAVAAEGGTPTEGVAPTVAPETDSETTPPGEPDNSESSLILLGGQSATQTVTMSRTTGGELRGTLTLAVRSKKTASRLDVSYLPTGSTVSDRAVSVQLGDGGAQDVKKNRPMGVPLVFTLPATASPQDLSGLLVIQPQAKGEPLGVGLELAVAGAGSALQGVSIQPEKLVIHVVSEVPTSGPDHASADVQLTGPGVPALFAPGAAPPTLDLLLRADNGNELHATLTAPVQSSENPTSATATVKINGRLKPGKYEGAAPISNLSTEAPKLSIEVESGNSFVYALLVVFAGALVGGLLYLASKRKRRKALLRDEVKALLNNYERVRKEVEGDRPEDGPSVWTLDQYLGKDKTAWYKVKWNAILDFDGAVQTIWSDIHWARDEDDLDEVSKEVEELKLRIVRWITVANSISVLQAAAKLKPRSRPGERWSVRKTPQDTNRLLEQIREVEPTDDKAAKDLIARINRQARWQEAFAEVWHAKTVLEEDMAADQNDGEPSEYDGNDRAMLERMDLVALDTEASPESARSAEKQIDLKLKVTGHMWEIKETYEGSEGQLELPRNTQREAGIGVAPQLALYASRSADGQVDEAIAEECLTESERETDASAERALGLRGTSATRHDGQRIPATVRAVLQRDVPWTLAIALVTSAAYIPTIYNTTWGTPADYVSAFAAGFLGKVAINWAAMPLFQSLRSRRSSIPASAEEKTEEEAQKGQAETAPANGASKPAPQAVPSAPAA